MNAFIYLMLAITTEIIATSALKASNGFTRLLPSVIVVIGYASAFYFLSLSLREIPLGVAYAIWSGIGTAATVVVGYLVYKEEINTWGLLGIALIIIGVLILNLLGKAHTVSA